MAETEKRTFRKQLPVAIRLASIRSGVPGIVRSIPPAIDLGRASSF